MFFIPYDMSDIYIKLDSNEFIFHILSFEYRYLTWCSNYKNEIINTHHKYSHEGNCASDLWLSFD